MDTSNALKLQQVCLLCTHDPRAPTLPARERIGKTNSCGQLTHTLSLTLSTLVGSSTEDIGASPLAVQLNAALVMVTKLSAELNEEKFGRQQDRKMLEQVRLCEELSEEL